MMRPVYTNTFSISRNPVNGEVILTFGHAYNEIKQISEGITESEVHRDEVISLVTTTRDLMELRDTLNKILSNN